MTSTVYYGQKETYIDTRIYYIQRDMNRQTDRQKKDVKIFVFVIITERQTLILVYMYTNRQKETYIDICIYRDMNRQTGR